MNKVYFIIISIILIYIGMFCINPNSKIDFWKNTRKGSNIFNEKIFAEDIRAAKNYGIKFIRLSPDKFATKNKDFLIKNADSYNELDKNDLNHLLKTLDVFHKEQMPVVITFMTLPGSRWRQNNNNHDDLRLWKEEKYQNQSAKFWKDVASALKNHPAIVGYNILNEPHPERIFDTKAIDIANIKQKESQMLLSKFYTKVIHSIRSVDSETPIIIDSSAYASPNTFKYLKPVKDNKTLYSFHMYEPYEYTNLKLNKGNFKYPGIINNKYWNKQELKNYMFQVTNFQKKYSIPNNRILVGEFGGNRRVAGLPEYFKDLISIFEENNWHFAFYSFREDTWNGMNYELGSKKIPYKYWQDTENGEKPKLKGDPNNPIFSVLTNALSKKD